MECGKAASSSRKVMVIADATRESASALQYALSHAILENDSLILLHVSNNHFRKHFSFFKKPGTSNNPSSPRAAASTLTESFKKTTSSASTTSTMTGSLKKIPSSASTMTESLKNNNNARFGSSNSGCGSVDLSFLEEMKKACKKVLPKIEVTEEVVNMNGKDKATVILSQCSDLGIDLLIIGQRRTLSSAILGKQKRSAPLKGDTAEYLIENSKCTCVAVHKKGQHSGYLLNTKTHRDFWLLA